MARILFASELGGGMGHLATFLPVLHELARRGHEIILALPRLDDVSVLLQREPFRYLQAPVYHRPSNRVLFNYGEIMLSKGYASPDSLTVLLASWRTLIELVGPDLVICDYSPTAMLASGSLNMAYVNTGTGFFMPPVESPLPCIRPCDSKIIERLKQSDQYLLDVIRKSLLALRLRPVESLSRLFLAPMKTSF